jgi:sialic acid synthase SpsE
MARRLHSAAGESVRVEDFVALRPGTGLPPGRRDGLIGRRLARAVREGEMVREEDFA